MPNAGKDSVATVGAVLDSLYDEVSAPTRRVIEGCVVGASLADGGIGGAAPEFTLDCSVEGLPSGA